MKVHVLPVGSPLAAIPYTVRHQLLQQFDNAEDTVMEYWRQSKAVREIQEKALITALVKSLHDQDMARYNVYNDVLLYQFGRDIAKDLLTITGEENVDKL